MSAKDAVSVVTGNVVTTTDFQTAYIDCSEFTSGDLYIIAVSPPASFDLVWYLNPVDPQTGKAAGHIPEGTGLYHGNLTSGAYTGDGAGAVQGDGTATIGAPLSALPGVRYRLDYAFSGSGSFSTTVTVTLVGSA